MDIQKLIQDEAERQKNKLNGSLPKTDTSLSNEGIFHCGFINGANFTLGLSRWVKVGIGMPFPEVGQRILVCYKDTIGLDTYQTGIELLHATHYMTFDLPPSQ